MPGTPFFSRIPERTVHEYVYGFSGSEVRLSAADINGTHYTLRYEEKRGAEGTARSLRKIELQVDRLYYLELLNGTVDDEQRLYTLYGIVGRRRFSKGRGMETFLTGSEPDLHRLRDSVDRQQGETKNDPIYYESYDRNLNIYRAYPLEEGNRRFVWLDQKNVSKERSRNRSFLIELDAFRYEAFLQLPGQRRKIEVLFETIGYRSRTGPSSSSPPKRGS